MKTLFMTLALVVAACADDGGGSESPKDAGIDAAPPGPDAGCFQGTPATHEEIINACTSAQKIYKNSRPPLLKADGSLPPLPP
jgi:hypothetical protein